MNKQYREAKKGSSMKWIMLVIILLTLISCWGTDENGNDVLILSKRDRCENSVRNSGGMLGADLCIGSLGGAMQSNSPPETINLILFGCLAYQFEMAKCKNESDILPP